MSFQFLVSVELGQKKEADVAPNPATFNTRARPPLIRADLR